MPRKATRKPKASVDAQPRAVRHSAREKDQAGSPPSASNPGLERTPRGDAPALAAAARYIRGDEGANRRDAGDAQQFHAEQERIQEWVRSQGCLIGEADFEALGVISNSTSEHEVRGRPADDRVVKKTLPGFYGQVPVWKNGRLERAPALPSQYLERQLLQNAIFNSEILLEGVLVSNKPSMIIGESSGQPAFVISQPFIKALQPGTPGPSEPQIAAFLAAHDFEPVTGSYFGWQRVSDGVVLLDARRDNFILSAEGVIPIDLQMAVIAEIRAKTPRKRAAKSRRRTA
jgi:hypothetical protein